MVVVVMGVAGTGKSAVGEKLAETLGVPFLDADAFHAPASIEKMRRGEPLTDDDRRPWLDRLNAELHRRERTGVVLACSALTRWSRRRLTEGIAGARFVLLHGAEDLLRRRLAERRGHFAGADLLDSQLATLEEPTNATVVDVADPLDVVVAHALAGLRGEPPHSA